MATWLYLELGEGKAARCLGHVALQCAGRSGKWWPVTPYSPRYLNDVTGVHCFNCLNCCSLIWISCNKHFFFSSKLWWHKKLQRAHQVHVNHLARERDTRRMPTSVMKKSWTTDRWRYVSWQKGVCQLANLGTEIVGWWGGCLMLDGRTLVQPLLSW